MVLDLQVSYSQGSTYGSWMGLGLRYRLLCFGVLGGGAWLENGNGHH